MLNLIAAEWLKLVKRPLSLVLLIVFLVLLLVQIAGQAIFVGLLIHAAEGSNLAIQAGEYRHRSVLPGVIGSAFGHVNGLGGIFAIILTAAAMGSEYSWGTLRTQLVRNPGRTSFILAKLLAILGILAVAMIVSIGVAILAGVIAGFFLPGTGDIGLALIAVPMAALRALIVLLPYVLLTLWLTIAGRSLLIGVAGGLVYLVFEGGFGALAIFAQLDGVWRVIYNLTIGQNINTLVVQNSHDFGLRPEIISPRAVEALPPIWQALVVVFVYSSAFLAMAIAVFRRHDVGGAG